jgi:hypothetical protein
VSVETCTSSFYSIFGMEVHRCYEYEQIVADSASYSVIYMRKNFLAGDSRDGSYKQERRIAHKLCGSKFSVLIRM